MRQLLYVSNTVCDFPEAGLESILAASRRANAAAGVTGLLLYLDGAFLQVLEGEAEAVDETYARILRDDRHWDVQTLLAQDAADRAFGEWSMGFQRLGPGLLDAEQAFRITRDAIRAKLTPQAPLAIATLLRSFQLVHGGGRAAFAS
ncbi:MAG: BLUF domain-containing protein [Rhizomicrobium sp.]